VSEPIDWSLTSFDGNRRRQHLEFRALPFREKLRRIELMEEVVARLTASHPRKQNRPVADRTGE